ncbi:12918_t:CDS:2 [Funneliformis geosporum]|uniref:12918_t:CDS:1 n=1 Tax=Funneliformis geosporum TaxID=1117311 RepID=A0A9W4SRJ9_9GLOM|nr:12918_t:CDS:2 [Funneliformis geosporum]
MSSKYFDQNPASWSVLDFLNKCELEPFQLKIDNYIKCLKTIVDNEQGDRKNSAQMLLDRYREASKYFFTEISGKSGVTETYSASDMPSHELGSQPDRQKAKGWEEKRLRGQTHIHQSINGNGNIVGNINKRNAETSSSSPSLEIPIVRPSTPEHQIYSTSVNQELIKQLNQEKKKVKSIL